MPSAESPSPSAVRSDAEEVSYRAILPTAVVALVLGVLSIVSFSRWWVFAWVVPPAAVLLGIIALRQIAAAPDVWAGARLAKTGVGVALACWVMSMSMKLHTTHTIRVHTRAVADRMLGKIRQGELEAAFWLSFPRLARQQPDLHDPTKVPGELAQRYMAFRTQNAALAEELSEGNCRLEYEETESVEGPEGNESAILVYKLHSPQGDRHVMLVLQATPAQQTLERDWFVQSIELDYAPHTHRVQPAGGHSHAH